LVEGAESLANVETNETDFWVTFGSSFIDFAQDEDNNETKKFIKGKEIEKILGEDMVKALRFMNYYGMDESRQSDVYKWYKESILRDELSPIGRVGAGIVGLFSQSKQSEEQQQANIDNANKTINDEKNKKIAQGKDFTREEFNKTNTEAWDILKDDEQTTVLNNKYGYSDLVKRLKEGSYGDSLSYDDCEFVLESIRTDTRLTSDQTTIPKGLYVSLALEGGGKFYKLVPVLRNNDPEKIYGKYPNLNNKYAWIKPDMDSNMGSKTYHPLSEFVKEFK
jgi:hypothetical protein